MMKGKILQLAGFCTLACTAALVSMPALADGTLVWRQKDQKITEEYRAPNHVRMTGSSDGYALFDGTHMYTVAKRDGKWHVFDVNQAMKAFGGKAPTKQKKVKPEDFTVHDLGRQETIAGITGEVYRIDSRDSDGTTTSTEAVIANNRDLYKLQTGINQSMMRGLGAKQSEVAKLDFAAMARAHGLPSHPAFLRYDNMRLVSYSKASPAASRFALPAKPETITMPNMSAMFGGSASGSSSDKQNSGGIFGGLFGKKVNREENRQKQHVNNRVNNETDKATDKVINKALDSLFGGG